MKVLIIICLFLVSCATSDSLVISKIPTDTEIVKVEKRSSKLHFTPSGIPLKIAYVKHYKLLSPKDAIIKLDKNKLSFNFLNGKLNVVDEFEATVNESSQIKDVSYDKFIVPYDFELDGVVEALKTSSSGNRIKSEVKEIKNDYRNVLSLGSEVKYINNTQNFQTITIPFKFRKKSDTHEAKLTTSVNVGFSYAFKKIIKTYKPISTKKNKNPIGYEETEFELGIAPFLGINAVELNKGNTQDVVVNSISVPGISYGGLVSIGINKFDVGIGIGWDHLYSKFAKNWDHQNDLWIGFLVGIDLIK